MKQLLLLFCLVICATSGFSSVSERYFEQEDSSMVYDFPEKMAQFPGGADAMESYIRKNMKYSEELKSAGVQGKVYVQFIVEKDGSITNVKVRRGSKNETLDAEAVRLIQQMPNWIPGSVRGKKVRVKQTLPITFSI